MNRPSADAVYSRLVRMYPRDFRDEYGTDMALLFAQQRRDESTSRVWTRCLLDLAITIPARHLEAHMNRPPNPAVTILFSAISISGLALAVLGGSVLGMLGFGLAIAVVAGGLAIVAWRHSRAISTARPGTEHWWQVLLVGLVVLSTTIVVVNVTGEVPEGWWLPMILSLLTGAVATTAGLVLGGIHYIESRPHRVAG